VNCVVGIFVINTAMHASVKLLVFCYRQHWRRNWNDTNCYTDTFQWL